MDYRLLSPNNVNLHFYQPAIASRFIGRRKVRTAKSGIPVKRRLRMVGGNTKHTKEKVPQKITARLFPWRGMGEGENVR